MKESLAATAVWHPLWAVIVPSAPKGESFGLRLAEMRHGLSQRLMNLTTFEREAHGESPAALRFFAIRKDAGKTRAFPSPQARFRANLPLQALYGGRLGWGRRGRPARVPPPASPTDDKGVSPTCVCDNSWTANVEIRFPLTAVCARSFPTRCLGGVDIRRSRASRRRSPPSGFPPSRE